MKRLLVVIALIASTTLPGSPAGHASPGPDTLSGSSPCRGVTIFIPADPAVVRAEGRIPERWKLALTEGGKARVYLNAVTCRVTVGGVARQLEYTILTGVLDSDAIPSPERERSTSNVMGMPFDVYLISWSSNDRDFVDWLRDGTGLGSHVQYAPGLSYTFAPLSPLVSGAFHDLRVHAPSPVPSPYELSASVTDSAFPVYPSGINYWRETPVGSLMIESTEPAPLTMGIFRQWKLTTDPSTPLGRMIGSGTASQTCDPKLLLIDPLLGVASQQVEQGCLTSDVAVGPTWRKDLP